MKYSRVVLDPFLWPDMVQEKSATPSTTSVHKMETRKQFFIGKLKNDYRNLNSFVL